MSDVYCPIRTLMISVFDQKICKAVSNSHNFSNTNNSWHAPST